MIRISFNCLLWCSAEVASNSFQWHSEELTLIWLTSLITLNLHQKGDVSRTCSVFAVSVCVWSTLTQTSVRPQVLRGQTVIRLTDSRSNSFSCLSTLRNQHCFIYWWKFYQILLIIRTMNSRILVIIYYSAHRMSGPRVSWSPCGLMCLIKGTFNVNQV